MCNESLTAWKDGDRPRTVYSKATIVLKRQTIAKFISCRSRFSKLLVNYSDGQLTEIFYLNYCFQLTKPR